MTRILVVTNLYPPHAHGGYGALCEAAVRRWRAAGHVVQVLTSDVRRPEVDGDGDDPQVQRALPMYWDEHELVHPPVHRRLAAERRTRSVVDHALDEFRPDVVSVWNLAALSFGILQYVATRHVPTVAVIGDRWLTFGPRLDAWARLFRGRTRRLAGRLVQRVTGLATEPPADLDVTVLFASRHLAEHAAATSAFHPARTAVVHHGVDLDAFPLVEDTVERPWRGRLVLVSRLDPRKGVATALRAVAQVPGTTLDVAGTGEATHRAALRELAGDLGVDDRVRFLGQCDRPRVRALYRSADAVLFPSEWDEPFGIVPLEAMATGAPVIGTGTGGSGEFLEHEVTCLRHPPGDDGAMAEAIRRLADDDVLRGRLRANGLRTAARLSEARALDRLERWHVAAAAGFPDGPPEHEDPR